MAQNTVPSSPSTGPISQGPPTVSGVIGGLQFPPGAALGPQLAGAALLGRALPPAAMSSMSQSSLPIKVCF